MKATSLLQKLRPRAYARFHSLPLFGPLIDEFCQWLSDQGYAKVTVCFRISTLHMLVDWLRCRRKRALADITQQDLRAAQMHFRGTRVQVRDAAGLIRRFLVERGLIRNQPLKRNSPSERELTDFVGYLRNVRGVSESTIRHSRQNIGDFLAFLGFNRRPSAIRALKIQQVDTFLREAAKKNNRFSLQSIVGTLRAYLRRVHAQGVLRVPLHEQIDTPRVYQLERLPRALPWVQAMALLRSIDRRHADGLRDFTMLYLAVRYGLRSSEVVSLRLDDINWRERTLRVAQIKTRHSLFLPLTDEAGDILCRYLREARPSSRHRELFLRLNAPVRPMVSTSINMILINRIRRSGLQLPHVSSHCLRHSFATHLLRQGAAVKDIGDALGHRSLRTTSAYLRLAVDDLRKMGLPVPKDGPVASLASPGWQHRLPRVRSWSTPPIGRARFISVLAPSLQEYLSNRHALGRGFARERGTLLRWDDFIHRNYPDHDCVGAPMFDRWGESLARLNPGVHRNEMRVVRNFLIFLRRRDPRTYVPDIAFFPKAIPYRAPRLVDEQEVARLLAMAKTLRPLPSNPLRGHTVRLALLLLFCCGLRRGELLGLRLADYDVAEELLNIKDTKFHKSRLVPLSPSVARELGHYLKLRCHHGLPMTSEAHLIWSSRSPTPKDGYKRNGLTWNWQHLCMSAGIVDARGRPPCLHDLRHSYAVAALRRCYAQGGNPQSKLQHLATYLGHATAISTHHYLHLTEDLRQIASRRFHDRFADLFKNGGAV
jgi:integrase/recombinase XerD